MGIGIVHNGHLCEIPNTTLTVEAPVPSRPMPQLAGSHTGRAAAGSARERRVPGLCQGWPRCSCKALSARCLPPHTQAVLGRVRAWRAKTRPNLKVMEDCQDQHEVMNFKHVLLLFGKAETLKSLLPWLCCPMLHLQQAHHATRRVRVIYCCPLAPQH